MTKLSSIQYITTVLIGYKTIVSHTFLSFQIKKRCNYMCNYNCTKLASTLQHIFKVEYSSSHTIVKLSQDSNEHASDVNLMPLPLLDLDQNNMTNRWHREVYEY